MSPELSVSSESDETPVITFQRPEDTTAATLFGDAVVFGDDAPDSAARTPEENSVVQASHYRQLQDQVAGLRSEIQQLQHSVPTMPGRVADAYCAQPACAECGCGESCRCDDYPVLFGAVEVPFLRARISGASPVFNVSPGAERLVDPNYDPAIRYVTEIRPEKTLGIRGRYFRYDHTSAFDPPFQPAELGIRLETADLEFVFHQDFRRWELDVSAGVEYARMEYSADIATAVIGAGSAQFEGVGPAFALNAEHELGSTTLSFFGSVRASFLMGTVRNRALLINMPRAEIKDEMMQVYQNQLGVVWKPEISERVGLAVRAAWETQFWLNETFSDDSYGIGSNLSLTGPMVSAELNY